MMTCRHPHIVDCFAVERADDKLCLVMELARRGDMADLLRRGRV